MKKYRNEWKYCCNDLELNLIDSRLKSIMSLDPHSGPNKKYYVHSMYFDDYKDTCAKANEAGIQNRYKWRIRYYNEFSDNIYLEKKEKKYGRCHKKKCKLSIHEYNAIIKGDISDIFWKTEKKLLKEFCVSIMTNQFVPKLIVDYERIAYIEPITNIRITLDTNISVSKDFSQFLIGNYQKYPLQDKNYHVLEVKFDEILPGYIKNIVCSYGFKQISFSKYYNGRKMMEEVLV